MAERLTPYLVATSVDYPKFRCLPTIKTAVDVGADGVQLMINPEWFVTGKEVSYEILGNLRQHNLKVNVIHLPGQLSLINLMDDEWRKNVTEAGTIGTSLIDPIPGTGKILIIHHSSEANMFPQASVTYLREIFQEIDDQEAVIGLEHINPGPEAGVKDYQYLSQQIGEYLEFLATMQKAGISSIAVLDITRFWSQNESLDIQGHQLLDKIMMSLAGQKVLLHAGDFLDFGFKPTYEINAKPIGQGIMRPHYEYLIKMAILNEVSIVGVVDESETTKVLSPEGTRDTRKLFSY